MFQLGVHAVISIIIYLIFIGLSFEVVKALRIEKFTRKGRIFETKILFIFIAIGLGYLVASLIINFIDDSLQWSNFF